jgi:transcriptional regulator with XRE-family HTH domain
MVMRFPEALEKWRRDNNVSQEELARLAGVSLNTARNWLRGQGPGPNSDHLRRLEGVHRGLTRLLFVQRKSEPLSGVKRA